MVEAPTLDAIWTARGRLSGAALSTPLVPLDVPGVGDVWLKLENLQPIGSFKIRGAGNAALAADPGALADGILTASAGNMAQGVAWWARRLGVPATAIVPEGAPAAKTDAIERLGGRVERVPYDRWWGILAGSADVGLPGRFVHPVADPDVIAGNATIGLEILDRLPNVETVLVPFGGGGLSSGIAQALRVMQSPARVIGCEVETATPLTASLAADAPCTVERRPSFVDGIGGKGVLPAMWPVVRELISGATVVTLDQVAAAIRLLVTQHRIVAEGAGAVSVAAALQGAPRGTTVCIVSGGNIQPDILGSLLRGVPADRVLD